MSVTREATVSMRVVRALLEYIEQAGVPRARMITAVGLDPDEVDVVDARISRATSYRICELAVDFTGDPAFGLHWAERHHEGTFVPISHLMAHAPTLRHGFASLVHFYRLLSDQAGFELSEEDDRAIVRAHPLTGESPRMQRFHAEMMVLGILRMLRGFIAHARIERASFMYSAPIYRAEYTRAFEGRDRFDQPFNGIVFDRALLDVPGAHVDRDVHAALQALAERRLLRLTERTPYALRVRELLMQATPPQRADMGTVARALGLSVRSLRRRLAEEGKSYNEVASEALAAVAKQLLRDKRTTIQETAYELGFSDTSTFHRAFKRWTGMTPSAYRDREREDQDQH